jgi:exopolysaccharide biosynthesis protein
MGNFWRNHRFGIVYGALLVAFTIYALLDVFLVAHPYEKTKATQQINDSSNSEGGNDNKTGKIITEAEYKDDNITISLSTYRMYDTDIYVADVKVTSAVYLKTSLAENTYGRNIKEYTSAIAEENNAILAINGDFYGAQAQGYVIRNGELYRSSAVKGNEDLVIYDDGSWKIIEESEISAEDLLDAGAQQVLAFGPALIEDNRISVTEKEEVSTAMHSNPRTAIGLIDDLHYVFVVSDGRTSLSEGLSLYQLARFMESLGAETAYNLDGGGSSTMYFNGSVINNPTTDGWTIKERSVSDIAYIGY